MDEAALLSDRVVIMDTRPGRVSRVIEVPFPRPRTEELTDSAEYREFTVDLSHQLEQMQRVDMARETTQEIEVRDGD
jgi:NitT/TauT family transport system ATP-binding protein